MLRKKPAKKKAPPKRTRIKLEPNEVVRLPEPPDHRPIARLVEPPVEVAQQPPKKKGWIEYLFGDWTK